MDFNLGHHYYRRRPAAAGLVAVVLAIGSVTKFFGIEAGVLAVVLAIVALVVAPHIYLPSAPPENSDAQNQDPDSPDTDRSTR